MKIPQYTDITTTELLRYDITFELQSVVNKSGIEGLMVVIYQILITILEPVEMRFRWQERAQRKIKTEENVRELLVLEVCPWNNLKLRRSIQQ